MGALNKMFGKVLAPACSFPTAAPVKTYSPLYRGIERAVYKMQGRCSHVTNHDKTRSILGKKSQQKRIIYVVHPRILSTTQTKCRCSHSTFWIRIRTTKAPVSMQKNQIRTKHKDFQDFFARHQRKARIVGKMDSVSIFQSQNCHLTIGQQSTQIKKFGKP